MSNLQQFNPLDKHNLGESVALALSRCPVLPLANLPSFKGAGIYALYYFGSFAPYSILSELNKSEAKIPIYVGKAVPKGSRKGLILGASQESNSLRGRLSNHARSIERTKKLKLKDFSCRFLIVEETWIGLCESLLIQNNAPLWNAKLDGFGRNPQGINRKDGVSAWHAFHSGRDLIKGSSVPEEWLNKITADVAAYMAELKARTAQPDGDRLWGLG